MGRGEVVGEGHREVEGSRGGQGSSREMAVDLTGEDEEMEDVVEAGGGEEEEEKSAGDEDGGAMEAEDVEDEMDGEDDEEEEQEQGEGHARPGVIRAMSAAEYDRQQAEPDIILETCLRQGEQNGPESPVSSERHTGPNLEEGLDRLGPEISDRAGVEDATTGATEPDATAGDGSEARGVSEEERHEDDIETEPSTFWGAGGFNLLR